LIAREDKNFYTRAVPISNNIGRQLAVLKGNRVML